ncbi:hypothetical protein GH733_015105 [Mirounga leonina]|nr:hypothetical protein GH733_015105 [Mirounga leonina]
MAVLGFTLGAFILVLHISSVANYPSGKVGTSCRGMVPEHGHTAHPDPIHNISVSQMTFRPGDQIEVTLSGKPFKGFLLEARAAEDLSGPPVGSFTLIDSQVSQLLTCEDVQGYAVSHTSPSKKTKIKVYWNAPSDAPDHVKFLVTVVEKYKIYWVKIPGPIISQPNALPFTTPEATRAPLSTFPPVSHLTKSGDDDAYLCIREDQTVHIQPSHLTGRSHPVMDSRVGALMFVAWMTTVGIGVLIARFFKSVWSKAFFGQAAWFQVHRMLMLTTTALTCIAFVLPFVYRGGWSWGHAFKKVVFAVYICGNVTFLIIFLSAINQL